MTMQSSNLLPTLQKLPGGRTGRQQSFRDHLTDIVSMDRAMYAAEFTSAASFGLWSIFDDINVDDTLASAYRAKYSGLAEDHSLHEQWQEMMERGPDSMQGFINGLKGQVAEFDTKELLEAAGYTNVELAVDPNHPVWDISATDPDGQEVLIQVKTVSENSASKIQGLIEANPDIHYAVSTEVYDKIADRAPDLVDQMTDIGSTVELEGSTEEGLEILSGNMGLDVPDGIVDLVPYAAVIVGGSRLIYSVIKTEKDFKAADRTTKNKMQVVQTLTIMSRMGISSVCAIAGGAGGTAVGSVVPFLGNAVGGIIGTIGGAGVGMYLNKHLRPHMLNLALNITSLTHDDLFYYKNKPRIDQVALTFRERAGKLVAAPA